jgi:hypothetical protein
MGAVSSASIPTQYGMFEVLRNANGTMTREKEN